MINPTRQWIIARVAVTIRFPLSLMPNVSHQVRVRILKAWQRVTRKTLILWWKWLSATAFEYLAKKFPGAMRNFTRTSVSMGVTLVSGS